MWKTHLSIEIKGLKIHNRCGKGCGKLFLIVENRSPKATFPHFHKA
jgi:hypothetical protein